MKLWEVEDDLYRAIQTTFTTFLISYSVVMLLEGSFYFGAWTPQGRVLCLIIWAVIYYYIEVRPLET